jgi:hypothetical protein
MPVAESGQLQALPRMRPAPRVVVGGPGWHEVETPPGLEVVRVDSLRDAVSALEAAVSG